MHVTSQIPVSFFSLGLEDGRLPYSKQSNITASAYLLNTENVTSVTRELKLKFLMISSHITLVMAFKLDHIPIMFLLEFCMYHLSIHLNIYIEHKDAYGELKKLFNLRASWRS